MTDISSGIDANKQNICFRPEINHKRGNIILGLTVVSLRAEKVKEERLDSTSLLRGYDMGLMPIPMIRSFHDHNLKSRRMRKQITSYREQRTYDIMSGSDE